jgi:hypothetical protein
MGPETEEAIEVESGGLARLVVDVGGEGSHFVEERPFCTSSQGLYSRITLLIEIKHIFEEIDKEKERRGERTSTRSLAKTSRRPRPCQYAMTEPMKRILTPCRCKRV